MYLPDGTFLQGGRYRIVRFISSGGFGCTYEAEHTMLGKKVAVKEFFVTDFCDRDGATARVTSGTTAKRGLVDKLRSKFVEEARATSMMQHPHIVKVYDVFEENGTAYYVMDFIEGPSLDKMVKTGGPLSEQTALKYIRQVADALAYVHSLNRLHLDLKPGNIMTDGRGNAVLVDFGASKQYDEAGGENTSTLIGKTPGYAPIEQMGNSVTTFSPATDIYALGATLYKLITGVTPPGSNLLASGEETLSMPRNISQGTANAIFAAMQTSKRSRPQSVAEFLSLLNYGSAGSAKRGRKISEDEVTIISLPPNSSVSYSTGESDGRVTELSLGGTKSSMINGHGYVDLGLSVKWATCNVGASSPSDNGSYFAWGETGTKSDYTEKNSVTYSKRRIKVQGSAKYDVARANWGGTWRLPTRAEFIELSQKCRLDWGKINGKNGYKVTGPNGNSIFFPAAGWRLNSTLYEAGRNGHYWSSTHKRFSMYEAYSLFITEGRFLTTLHDRSRGRSIRPVSD